MAIGLRCHGKVQGVYYRATARLIAVDLNLKGWVKNEADGTVLMHAEGAADDLVKFERWCHRGPEFASVLQVDKWDKPDENFTDFEVRY